MFLTWGLIRVLWYLQGKTKLIRSEMKWSRRLAIFQGLRKPDSLLECSKNVFQHSWPRFQPEYTESLSFRDMSRVRD